MTYADDTTMSKLIAVETTSIPSTTVSAEEAAKATTLFNQAISDGWNLEMDWLWLATKVTLDGQRQQCLERALAINPANAETRKVLKRLRSSQR